MCHHSGQNVMDSCGVAEWRIVVDNSTDHVKPDFDLLVTIISKKIFSEHELTKALRDTLT